MNEQPIAPATPISRNQLQVKLARLRHSTPLGMFGIAEIIAVGASAVLLLLVLVSYLYFLVPARSRLQSLELVRVNGVFVNRLDVTDLDPLRLLRGRT